MYIWFLSPFSFFFLSFFFFFFFFYLLSSLLSPFFLSFSFLSAFLLLLLPPPLLFLPSFPPPSPSSSLAPDCAQPVSPTQEITTCFDLRLSLLPVSWTQAQQPSALTLWASRRLVLPGNRSPPRPDSGQSCQHFAFRLGHWRS